MQRRADVCFLHPIHHLDFGRKILQIDYVPDFGLDGTVSGAYMLGNDVTDSREAQASLGRLVRLDTLTGLYNRYQFNEELPVALARSARSGQALALMFMDVDHFKQVNDTWGHTVGDLVLKEFADRLKHSVRQTDLVARLSGDEFVVLLEGIHHAEESACLARKILAAVNQPFEVSGHALTVSCSIGIGLNDPAAKPDPMDLLARADAALYQAKASGRGTFMHYPGYGL
jgi:diguanylate cyclase (GGDEF)-like protein